MEENRPLAVASLDFGDVLRVVLGSEHESVGENRLFRSDIIAQLVVENVDDQLALGEAAETDREIEIARLDGIQRS